MRKFFITGFCTWLCLFCSSKILAQTPCTFATITEGPVQKETASEIRQVLGTDGKSVYMVKRISRMGAEIHICKANQENVETLDKEIEVSEYEGHGRRLDFFAMTGNRLWVFSAYTDKKANTFNLTCDELSTENFEIIGQPKIVSKTEYEKRRDKGYFFLEKSSDQSKLLIYAIYPDDENPGIQYEFTVFDNSMNSIWQNKGTLDMDGKYALVKEFMVTNSGNVLITACEYPDRKSLRTQGTGNYQYNFYKIEKEKSPKKFSIDLEGKFVTDIKIREDVNGNLACLGFFSNRPQINGDAGSFIRMKERANGVFNISLDANGEVLKKSMSDFSADFYTDGDESEKEKKKKKSDPEDLTEFDIREVIPAEDGGTFIIAEQFYVNVSSNTTTTYNTYKPGFSSGPATSNQSQVYIDYFFNDIIAIRLDANGSILWTTVIKKRQHDVVTRSTTSSGYMSRSMAISWINSKKKPDLYTTLNENGGKNCSFFACYQNKKLNIFFNDNPKNSGAEASLSTRVYRMGKGAEIAFSAVEIDSEGKQKREILYSQSKRGEALIMPIVSMPTSTNRIFVVGDMGKKFQFFNVEVKN